MKKTKFSLLTLAILFSTHISCMELATTEKKLPLLELSPKLYVKINSFCGIKTVGNLKSTCAQLNEDTHCHQISPEVIQNEDSDLCTTGLLRLAQTHAHNIKNNTLENNLIQHNPMLEANFNHLLLNNPDERDNALIALTWDQHLVKTCSKQEMMDMYTILPGTLQTKKFSEIIDNPTAIRIIASIAPNTKDKSGFTILYYSCSFYKKEMIQSLLKIPGIDVNQALNNGQTPLHCVCLSKFNSLERVSLLLNAPGINVNKVNHRGETALHFACKENNLPIVEALLKIPGINGNISNKHGETALHLACCENRLGIVRALLKIPGINGNISNKHGETPLHVACYTNNLPIVEALLKIPGINGNIQDNNGETPLHVACKDRAMIVYALLNTPSIKVNISDEHGETPLYVACQNNLDKTVEAFLSATGIVINTTDDNIVASMNVAEYHKNTNIIQLLLNAPGIDDTIRANDRQQIIKLLTDYQSTHSQK